MERQVPGCEGSAPMIFPSRILANEKSYEVGRALREPRNEGARTAPSV